MITEQVSRGFEDLVASDVPLRQVVAVLRSYRSHGLSRQDAQQFLERMRGEVRDEPSEDRLLEVLDIVNGFCSAEMTVWDD